MIREFNGIKELEIFWSFVVDENLPKYKKDVKVENDRNGNTISFNDSGVPMMDGSWGSTGENEVVTRKDLIKKPTNMFPNPVNAFTILYCNLLWKWQKF